MRSLFPDQGLNPCPLHCCCCLITKPWTSLLCPRGLSPASLLCPWDFPGKGTGVGCISFSRGTSWPRDQISGRTCISCFGKWIVYCWATRAIPSPALQSRFLTTGLPGETPKSFLINKSWYLLKYIYMIGTLLWRDLAKCLLTFSIYSGKHGRLNRYTDFSYQKWARNFQIETTRNS